MDFDATLNHIDKNSISLPPLSPVGQGVVLGAHLQGNGYYVDMATVSIS